MNDNQVLEYGFYVRDLANRLALRDWTFVLEPEHCTPGRNAEIQPCFGRKHATLRLSNLFLQMPAGLQRHTLVHELMHCHLAELSFYIQHLAFGDALRAARIMQEMAVDGLADAMAILLPLPQFEMSELQPNNTTVKFPIENLFQSESALLENRLPCDLMPVPIVEGAQARYFEDEKVAEVPL